MVILRQTCLEILENGWIGVIEVVQVQVQLGGRLYYIKLVLDM